ncbi:MAG: chloride channel protein [Acidimicrobiales bacterium]
MRKRLPTGRGASEQPNTTGAHDALWTPTFALAVVITGIATGLLGDLLMMVLFGMEHLVFGRGRGDFQSHVEASSYIRRVVSLMVAGAFGGPAWFLLRKYTKGEKSEVDEAIWAGDGRLSFRRSLGTALTSEVVIGMGASIGREAAPKLMGGVAGSVTSDWLRLSTEQRRLLVACGGGAGLAAVYDVPLGGAAFTAELLVGSFALSVVLPAILCSTIATTVAWIYLPDHATYLGIADFRFTATIMVWALIAGPVIGVFAFGYIRLVGFIAHHRLSGRRVLVGPFLAFTVLGVIGIAYPGLFGNGKDMAHRAFLGEGSLALLLALTALKPLVTSLCVGSGASGGLFTPFMSTGAVFGAATGIIWSSLWPGSPIGAFALIGAAAMIGAAMQAPLSGLVLVVELTQSGLDLMVPILAATFLATAVARQLDGYSIYSARLPAQGHS